MTKNKAFTLIEIIIVLFIVGTILAIIGPRIARQFGRGKEAIAKMRLETIKTGLQEYLMDMGHYPTKKEGGIQALVTSPEGAEKWRGPYAAEDDLVDSFGNPIEVNIPPVKYKQFKQFEIIAPGEEEGREIFIGA